MEKTKAQYNENGCLIAPNIAALAEYEGQKIGSTDWLEVTQEMINKFADATLDFQWIHLDTERAERESPFGRTVAHGLLSLSLLPYFTYQLLKIESAKMSINYGYNKIRFMSPVLSGHRIRMTLVLKNIEREAKGVKLIAEKTVEIEGVTKPACVAESVSFIIE